MNQPLRIAILRPGTFTSIDGTEHSYSEADLAGIAAAYDPATDPAPLVIGHPKTDHPAYGWVKGIAFADGELVAEADPETLDPAFAELVNAGRYRRVSASFYPPRSKSSPKPGGSYLKHIGFLGAKAPAVKGLGTVQFADGDEFITIETDRENEMPKDTVDLAEREADIERREGELQERATTLATREAAIEKAAATARHDANVAFAEVLAEGGKLAPAGKALVVGIMDDLNSSDAVSFGEAEGELTPLAAFKKLFDGAGTIVAFGEHAAPKGGDGKEDPQDIADRAVAYAEEQRAAGRIINIAAAVRHVMKDEG